MARPADLIAYLFEGQPGPLPSELEMWMETSPRFTVFVATYQDKIRKKIRSSREPESLLDLRSELAVANALLAERRLAVAYEPFASAKKRGPDFTVTYRVNQVFTLEVARVRAEGGEAVEGEFLGSELARRESRIQRILMNKLGQLQPGMANLLLIHAQEGFARSIDLDRLMQAVKIKAEGKDPAFYAASRYATPTAFYKDFLHLNGILLWAEIAQLWVNKQARPGLDEKILRQTAQVLSKN